VHGYVEISSHTDKVTVGQVFILKENDPVKVELAWNTVFVVYIDFPSLIKNEPLLLGKALESLPDIGINTWLPRCCTTFKKYDWPALPDALSILTKEDQCIMPYYGPSKDAQILVPPLRDQQVKEYLRSDSTYVLAGQGGLGMRIARMLAANGVKHIVLLSRSGATNEASRGTIALLQRRGVNVKVVEVDICDRKALQNKANEIAETMPAVRGLFQCAAVIRDAVFENMTYENWRAAIEPKTIGSWNLYELFPRDMDFIVFLSSSAGVIGNRGQANYAAGNAFQDALARHISSRGRMRSVSLDLGPVLGAGMLAEDPNILDKLKAAGFFGVRLEDFERVVECAVTGYAEGSSARIPPQVVMGVGTGGLMLQNRPADPYWARTALFSHLNKIDVPPDADGGKKGAQQQLQQQTTKGLLSKATTAEEARKIVATGLCTVLAVSMGKSGESVDKGRPPSSYGVDSLIAVGIRTWVSRECGVDISVFEVLSDTTIYDLSMMIVERGNLGRAN
jgi:NAD(P)-dependent dehydrogenase (short-subunit alcohol dehydrogenase family)